MNDGKSAMSTKVDSLEVQVQRRWTGGQVDEGIEKTCHQGGCIYESCLYETEVYKTKICESEIHLGKYSEEFVY